MSEDCKNKSKNIKEDKLAFFRSIVAKFDNKLFKGAKDARS